MADKVYVESMVNALVTMVLPGSNIRKEWKKKGQKLAIERELLKEAYYDPGVEYAFTHGILYTDDMDFKKDVDIEPQEAEAPVNLIKFDEARMKRLISLMPISQAKEELASLSANQKQELISYILTNPSELKMDRVELINSACNVNLLKAIELKKANEEE